MNDDIDLQEAEEVAEDVLACLCPPTLTVGHFSDCPQAGTFRDLRVPINSPEHKVLVKAISWSNANLYFEGLDYATNNDVDHRVAADILRGLRHYGWTVARRE